MHYLWELLHINQLQGMLGITLCEGEIKKWKEYNLLMSQDQREM